MSTAVISVENVSKSFKLPHEKVTGLKQAVISFRPGKKFEMQEVLKDITFDIKKGEFFGIVGRNGSGKSTLLKLLAQIYTPDKGAILVNGSLTPFIELGVGFNPELTGRENVFLNGALLGFDRRQVAEMYEDIVSFAELERFMDQRLKNYSSGMQVRLAFSIAVRAKSDILLIDEVLAVGDAAFQQKCYRYFNELKKNDTTVVLVTHDMSAVNRFCDRALMVENGLVKIIGDPVDVASQYTIDNVESDQASMSLKAETDPNHSIAISVSDQSSDSVTLKIPYGSVKDDFYIGISIISDGITVAEINTLDYLKLSGSGVCIYELDTKPFNAGVYEVSAALLLRSTKEMLGIVKKRTKFVIKGSDPTRAGTLKLAANWRKE